MLLLALLAQVIRSNNAVVPPVQSSLPVVDTFPLDYAVVHMPKGHSELTNVRTRLIGYHAQHNGSKSDIMYSHLVALQLKHTGTCASIRLDKRCVIYVIYNRKHDKRMYVGLTHLSAWGRFRAHLKAANAYYRRPPGGRNFYQKAHLLYRIWSERGVKDWAVFPMEVLENDPSSCSSKVFARRHAEREAFWINTLKVLHPRVFNVRNGRPARHSLNAFRHKAQRLRRRTTPSTLPDAPTRPTASTTSPLTTRGSNATPGDLKNSLYARTAYTFLAEIYRVGAADVPPILPPDHYIVIYLSNMRHRTVVLMLRVMRDFTLEQLNSLRPTCTSVDQDGTRAPAGPPWSADATQLIIRVIEAYLDCTVRHSTANAPLSHRRLLIVQFSHPGLDEVGLGRLLNESEIVSAIPDHYREKVGRPLVVFKYAKPLGLQWNNTRHYAHMSDTALSAIRDGPCSCASIPDKYKHRGHLRTSDPGILADPDVLAGPSANLRDLCAMGSKFRPGLESTVWMPPVNLVYCPV